MFLQQYVQLASILDDIIDVYSNSDSESSLMPGAQPGSGVPTDIAGEFNLAPDTNAEYLIMRIINFALWFLGLIMLIAILYGGFLIMTAGGNEENLTKGKKVLVGSIAGLVVILSSYAVVMTFFTSKDFIFSVIF